MHVQQHKALSRPGFSLIELVVVIGVIAIVLALLLPVLSSVRGKSLLSDCATRQREVTRAALLRAQDADGFLPLAGELAVPGGTAGFATLPAALGDAGRRRYVYLPEPPSTSPFLPTREDAAAFPVALMPYLGNDQTSIDDGVLSGVEEVKFHDLDGADRFICPAASPDRKMTRTHELVIGETSYIRGQLITLDFALNAGVLGFHHDSAFNDVRRRGHLARVPSAASTLLLGDAHAGFGPAGGSLLVWAPAAVDLPVTMADMTPGSPRAVWAAPLDPARHDRRMNIAYLDGHVAAASTNAESLEKVVVASD
jgi:prepilin-type processing-associated H-X9-DG protein/prepilin-type N-terminal cleavage/methylation domain-containing protein